MTKQTTIVVIGSLRVNTIYCWDLKQKLRYLNSGVVYKQKYIEFIEKLNISDNAVLDKAGSINCYRNSHFPIEIYIFVWI